MQYKCFTYIQNLPETDAKTRLDVNGGENTCEGKKGRSPGREGDPLDHDADLTQRRKIGKEKGSGRKSPRLQYRSIKIQPGQ